MQHKIAYLCSSSSWGGLEMNQLRNALWMQERGHAVMLLCLEHSPAREKALAAGISVRLIGKHRKYYDHPAALRLVRILKEEGISHLVIRDTRDMSIGALAKLYHSSFHFSYFMEMQLGVKKTNLLHTLRFRKLDLWSCPLHWLQEQVRTMTRMDMTRTIVIPSGLELEPFRTVPSREEARQLLDLPQDKTILGLIGRFDPHKGQLLLLEALRQIKDPSVCVCLLGEPTRNEGTGYLDQIWQSISDHELEDRVFVRPFREDIPVFYQAADALVMASRAETFGMVTIEAMATGKPVIGSKAGGTPEILEEGRLGYLFTPNDAQSLAGAIHRFLADPGAIPASLLQESAEQYDHRKVCRAVESVLGISPEK